MSYTDWRDWALGEGADCPDDNQETWRRVAECAESDARYEDPDAQPEGYRRELGDRHPTTKSQFTDVCQNHQLSGSPVEGDVPGSLVRCIKRRDLQTQLNDRLEIEERAGRDFRQTSSENHELRLPEIKTNSWSPADVILPDLLDDLYLSSPEKNRVFATPVTEETEQAAGGPANFLEHLKNVQRPGWSLADEAVYRLTLAKSPSNGQQSSQERILLVYDSASFDHHRYPVPPDAEFWRLFRPIERAEESPYGKTCPGGHPCDEERAEPELVHSNPPIAAERVLMRSLGRTNPT